MTVEHDMFCRTLSYPVTTSTILKHDRVHPIPYRFRKVFVHFICCLSWSSMVNPIQIRRWHYERYDNWLDEQHWFIRQVIGESTNCCVCHMTVVRWGTGSSLERSYCSGRSNRCNCRRKNVLQHQPALTETWDAVALTRYDQSEERCELFFGRKNWLWIRHCV